MTASLKYHTEIAKTPVEQEEIDIKSKDIYSCFCIYIPNLK